MKATSLKAFFTRRYRLAIFLIALLSTATLYILILALHSSESTALIVNISGKQRMLSQRIASLSQQYTTSSIHHDLKRSEQLKVKIHNLMTEMRQAHEKLSTGHFDDQNIPLTKQLQTLYFGEPALDQAVKTYLSLANEIITTTDTDTMIQKLDHLLMMSETLLPLLHKAVSYYQAEGESRIQNIHNLEIYAWLLTLFTLAMEIQFIFQPMAKTIQELFEKHLKHKSYTEEQIAIKTHSLREENSALSHLATHDPLTGIHNRLGIDHHIEALAQQHIPFGIAIIDIDYFKSINDDYGHDAGDFVLKECVNIILSQLRSHDTLYRMGGEEFLLIAQQTTDETLLTLCERIRLAVATHIMIYEGEKILITISCGGFVPKTHLTTTKLIKKADQALYQAKNSGRNQTILLTDDHRILSSADSNDEFHHT